MILLHISEKSEYEVYSKYHELLDVVIYLVFLQINFIAIYLLLVMCNYMNAVLIKACF